MGTPRGGVRAYGLAVLLAAAVAAVPVAQTNRIDGTTPAAPELAAPGPHAVGVRTLTAVDRNRPDILQTKAGGPTARYDRRPEKARRQAARRVHIPYVART